MVCLHEEGGGMTNREMAIRLAASTIEQMLKYDNSYAQQTLNVLKAEIEVFDLLDEIAKSK